MPQHTSQLYGTNIVHLLKLLTPGKDGELALDLDDPVQRGMTVAHGGEVLWPPPPVQVSAAPAPPWRRARPPSEAERGRGRQAGGSAPARRGARRRSFALARSLVRWRSRSRADASSGYFTVFVLAVFVGFYVIIERQRTRCTRR